VIAMMMTAQRIGAGSARASDARLALRKVIDTAPGVRTGCA
jgi:hypothetical protein